MGLDVDSYGLISMICYDLDDHVSDDCRGGR